MDPPNAISAASTLQQRKASRKPRLPLSCDPCRSRKLKCNRESPCQNCTVRGELLKCDYKNTKQGPASAMRHVQRDAMQQRLDRLEQLVTTLTSQNQESGTQNSTNGGDVSEVAISHASQKDSGTLKVDDNHSLYQGATHWSDVMHEVNALKSAWGRVQDEDDFSAETLIPGTDAVDGPSLLCGLTKPVDLSELLATLPSKPALDRLIAKFFDYNDRTVPMLPILHGPSFMKQYADYWANPSKTSVMWLGMLFSILNLTMLGYVLFENEPPEYKGVSGSLAELYRLRTAQCLMMGDITKGSPYTLETLIFNCIGEHSRKKDNERGVWMMVGVIVRAALQMGYHRDPSQYPEISVFQGELRRRIWCYIAESDALTSFLVGLPSMVKDVDRDSAEPRNVFDWELTEDMSELPPSRPLTDPTPIGYLIAKSRLLNALGGVVNFLSSLHPQSYDTVLNLDKKLSKAHMDIPPHLKMPSLEVIVNSPSALNSMRMQLEFYYHQGMCVLHRKFIASSRHDAHFALSRQRCLESAAELLSMQNFLYEETLLRGSIRVPLWFRVSFYSHDFILPATLLFLDLRFRKDKHNLKSHTPWIMNEEEIGMIRHLKQAHIIWEHSQHSSPEAQKFQRVLSRMLEDLDSRGRPVLQQRAPSIASQHSISDIVHSTDTLTMEQNGNPSTAEMEVDWTAWNSFIEGASFDDAYMSMSFDEFTGNGDNFA